MKRNAIKRWMGACLLGSALATGCSQLESRVADRPPWVGHSVARPQITKPAFAQRKPEEPHVKVSRNGPPPDTLPAAASEEKDTGITQTALDGGKTSPPGDLGPARKSFVDVTAHPCFSHAEDYSWLSGQIQHSRIAKAWRLRYASVDEVDPYGGSVTLMDDARVAGLKDGDFVRVHGRFVNPEGKGIAPPYEGDFIQPVGKQE